MVKHPPFCFQHQHPVFSVVIIQPHKICLSFIPILDFDKKISLKDFGPKRNEPINKNGKRVNHQPRAAMLVWKTLYFVQNSQTLKKSKPSKWWPLPIETCRLICFQNTANWRKLPKHFSGVMHVSRMVSHHWNFINKLFWGHVHKEEECKMHKWS